MLKPVDRAVVSDQVYQQLRDEIIDRQYQPGDTLPSERQLCEILNVNRSSIREALKRLEQARLVDIKQGGGITVLDFNLHAGFDLLPWLITPGGKMDPIAIRSILEFWQIIIPEIARFSALRIQPPEIKKLEKIVEDIEACTKDQVDRYQELDFQFHYILAHSSENLAFILLYNSIREMYDRARVYFTPMYEATLVEKGQYRLIFKALSNHEPEKAFKLSKGLNEIRIQVFWKLIETVSNGAFDNLSTP